MTAPSDELRQLLGSFSEDELDAFNSQLEQRVAQKQMESTLNQNPSLISLFQEGLQESTGNLVLHDIPGVKSALEFLGVESYPTLREQSQKAQRDLGFLQNLVKGTGNLIGELPAMGLGGLIGGGATAETGPGAILGAGAGAFAVPTLIRESYTEYQKFFEDNPDVDLTWGEYLEAAGRVSKETGKSAAIGAATATIAPLVKVLGKIPGLDKLLSSKAAQKTAEVIGEATTISGGRAALEGEFPDSEDFAQNLLLLAGFRATRAGAKAFGEWARGKELTGQEAVEIINDLDEAQREAFENAETVEDVEIILENPKPENEPIPEIEPDIVQAQEEIVPAESEVAKELGEPVETPEPKFEVLNVGEEPSGQNLTVVEEGGKEVAKFENVEYVEPERNSEFWNKLNDRFSDISARWGKIWSVEDPFRRVGGNETGRMAKLYYSTIENSQREAVDLINTLKSKGYDRRDRGIITLLAEGKELPEKYRQKYQEGYDLVRDYFDKSFEQLKEVDALSKPFPDSLIARIEKENADLQTSMKKAKSEAERNELLAKYRENQRTINQLRNTSFVHIPYADWFTSLHERGGEGGRRLINAINSLTNKQRKSVSIADLLNSGAIKPENIDIADVLGSYGMRKGKDLGIYKIMKAAQEEGLASTTRREGFERIPKWASNVANKFYVHPAVYDFLTPILKREPNAFLNFMGKVKGWQFYNPLFLPGYDLYQSAMLGTVNPLRPIKTARYFRKAIQDVLTKNENYQTALEEGLASSPFNITQQEYQRMIERSKQSVPERFQEWLSPKIMDKIYEASSEIAWQLDRTIRMASYNKLLEDGYSPKDAAQIAAEFHADYASVPPKTRRFLNGVFFTPTFKVAMGKLWKNMAKGTAKVGKAILKGEKIDPKDRTYAQGMVNTMALLGAMHLWMTRNGFDADIYGYRYSKPVVNDEGEDKELVIVLPSPANLPIKYAGRAYNALSDPGELNAWEKIARNMSWEISPVWRITGNLITNKSESGAPITDIPGNTPAERALDRMKYVANQVLPWTQLGEIDEDTAKSLQKVDEELGQTTEFILRPFMNHYVRDSYEKRQAIKVKRIWNELRERQMRAMFDPKTDVLTEAQMNRYLDRIDAVMKDLDEHDKRKRRKQAQ